MQDVPQKEQDYLPKKLCSKAISKLKYNREFILIKTKGFALRKPGLTLKFLKSDERKWAVCASKFAYKQAVGRNLAKRRMREIIRQDPPLKNGHYLLLATSLTNKIPFADLKSDYRELLSKIRH